MYAQYWKDDFGRGTHKVANLDWCDNGSRPIESATKVKILSQLGHPNFFLGRNGWKQPKMQYKQKKVFWWFLFCFLRHEVMTIGAGEETSLSATSTLLKVKVVPSMRELGIVPWSRLRYFSEGSTDEMGNGISRERKGIELRMSRLQFPLDLWRLFSVPSPKKRSTAPFGD